MNARSTAWILPFQAFLLYACAFMFTLAHAQAQDRVQKDIRRSGFEFMSPQTQALQRDDSQNPAMLWVETGRALWSKSVPKGNSCADCHGMLADKMKSVAATYPKYSTSLKRVVNLGQQINQCRTTQQKLSAFANESEDLLALESAIAFQSRGMSINPPKHVALTQAQREGERLFNARMGQVDLSCRDCHVTNAGKRLSGSTIPEAHPTAYPIYRLEWQTLGSLQRRLRGCFVAVRAEPFAPNSREMIALEAFLAKRAAGMIIESPGVRP
jgi:L-cysteine S-thiosulfotransferase